MKEDGVRITRVGTPEDDDVRLLNLTVGACTASRTKHCRQTDDTRRVSSAVAAINIVGAHDLSSELLCGKVHLVIGFGATENAEGLRSGLAGFVEPNRYAG